MEKHRNLPFAMYDLAVYLPGGAIALLIAKFAFESIFGSTLHLPFNPEDGDTIGVAVKAVIWLSASYLAGHLAAFISTYVIEKLVHNNLGFPSEIWLELENSDEDLSSHSQFLRGIFTRNLRNFQKNLVNYVIVISQIPAFIPILLFLIRKPFGFYSPKLPVGVLNDVKFRYKEIGIDIPIKNGSRWEKIVEHFVANNCDSAYARMYNYLVIYGALRLLSLLILMVMWSILIIDCIDFFRFKNVVMDYQELSILFTLSWTYILAVMAFAKFNRRYFEETIMALLLAPRKSIDN